MVFLSVMSLERHWNRCNSLSIQLLTKAIAVGMYSLVLSVRTAVTAEALKKGKVFKQVVYVDVSRGYVFYLNHTRRLASIDQTCSDLKM